MMLLFNWPIGSGNDGELAKYVVVIQFFYRIFVLFCMIIYVNWVNYLSFVI